ncbi:MAG: hypothetical protein JXB05_03740 [Myxococcaceae bacterium]|nr:hypothetical protein [Myxococcaceae bacterium]
MRRLATAVCTVPVLIGWLVACTHTAPSGGTPPEQIKEEQQKAADLLGRVKQRYIELNPSAQRITQRTRTILRTEDQPDTETVATLVTLQAAGQQRTEMTESEVLVHPKEAGGQIQRYPGGKMVAVRNGGVILVNYEGPTGPDGKPVAFSYKIDESKLDPSLASLYAGDLATLKLFDMLAQEPLQFRQEASQGTPVYVIETTRPIAMAADTQASLELWINPTSLLVEHMEMDFDQEITVGKPHVVHGVYEGSFTYEFDVPLPRDAFGLALHPNAEDLTDEVQAQLKANPEQASPR